MRGHQEGLRSVGICVGASTVTAVELQGSDGGPSLPSIARILRKTHDGNPAGTLQKTIEEWELGAGRRPVLMTGRQLQRLVNLPGIGEPEAIEHALRFLGEPCDAVVSAGGETIVVYELDKNLRISGVSTGNKCASGTGEFFLQQIRRMDLTAGKAVELASMGKPYRVSGRCSVFCKTDCTHALNKGVPIADVTSGLCEMIAEKIVTLLKRVRHGRVLLIGGLAENRAVIAFMRREIENLIVPANATCFEALGAALAGFSRGSPVPRDLFQRRGKSYPSLPPLSRFEKLVSFSSLERGRAAPRERCLLGLDVGSTTTKAVLLRAGDHALLCSVYLRTNGNPVEAARSCFQVLHDSLAGTEVKILGIGVTGSGRHIAGLYAQTEGIINEIIAHARAAVHFDPRVDTIFEIGGQDAKYTYITHSVASDYAMNQACSAGTGSFLEEAAWESLGVKTEEIAEHALAAGTPPNFNDQCSAFIASDIKNAGHEGFSRDDILAGLVYSICFNYINRVKGNRPAGRRIFMQGGVCYNRAVPLAMAGILSRPIVVPPEPGLMGAFGVALELESRMGAGLIEEGDFQLPEIIRRRVENEEPFTCSGGGERCDLKCSIARIRLEGKVFPFGGACDRYYQRRPLPASGPTGREYVSVRNRLMLEKYSPPRPVDPRAPALGLNLSFVSLSLFPLYHNFFSLLGCRIVLPDQVEEASSRLVTSMCYPAEIAAGFFQNLIAKRPDYIFIPFIKELPVPGGPQPQDFCSLCGLSRGEPYSLKQAFLDRFEEERILSPFLNLRLGLDKAVKPMLETARRLGFPSDRAGEAFKEALSCQQAFEQELKAVGAGILAELEAEPDGIAFVLFGRPYNAYVHEANKFIPEKIARRGFRIIPYDMLPYESEPMPEEYAEYMHWEAGQRLLRAARLVKKNRRLFGIYITNFLCAPDSFLAPYFRRVMNTKPSLTLELDAHTADVGITTRIDAFIDIVKNYTALQAEIRDPESTGKAARVSYTHRGACYVDSADRRHSFTDPAVKLLIPSLGYFGNRAMAAVFRRLKIRTEPLPPSDNEVLALGKSATTGKECLPLIVCLGSLLRYLKYRDPAARDEKLMMLLPKAAGYCRLGQYHVHVMQYLKDNRIEDVTLLDLSMDHNFAGIGPLALLNAWKAIVVTDVIDDIECSLRALARDPERAGEVLRREGDRICEALEGVSGKSLYRQLEETAEALRAVPLRQPYAGTARVGVTGEFFVRRDPFSNLGITRILAERGFLVSIASLTEVMYYVDFMQRHGIKRPEHTLATWLELFLAGGTQRHTERRIKRILSRSGLCAYEPMDIDDLVSHSSLLIPKELDGEPALVSGLTMRDGLHRFCGIVNIGPFGCMQARFADAITIPQATVAGKRRVFESLGKECALPGFSPEERIPYLSVESDGNPYPQLLEARLEIFCLQAGRAAVRMGKKTAGG